MSQNDAILEHLQAGRAIDPLSALTKFGSFRLAARISELRQLGHKVKTKIIKTRTGKHIALYWLP